MGAPPDANDSSLSQTEAALGRPLTALTPSAAGSLLDHWRSECLAANTDLDLTDVAAGLGALQSLLGADALDGRAIGAALRSLGDSTAAVAAQTPDEQLSPRLDRIASLLARAAAGFGA